MKHLDLILLWGAVFVGVFVWTMLKNDLGSFVQRAIVTYVRAWKSLLRGWRSPAGGRSDAIAPVKLVAPDAFPPPAGASPKPKLPDKPDSGPPRGALTLVDELIAANPDSPLAKRLRRRERRLSPPQWLEWIAREMQGSAVFAQSNVAGHVTWLFEGRRFYYYEMQLEQGNWTFITARVEESVLPTFQVRVRDGYTPFPPLPQVWPEPVDLPRFDGVYEIRLIGGLRANDPPVSAVALAQYLALERRLGSFHVLEANQHRCRLAILGIRPEGALLRPLLLDVCRLLETVIRPYAGEAQAETSWQLVDALRTMDEGELMCRVCGEGLRGARIECVRCGAPHHEDCWAYTGGCAIYACLGREGRKTGA